MLYRNFSQQMSQLTRVIWGRGGNLNYGGVIDNKFKQWKANGLGISMVQYNINFI